MSLEAPQSPEQGKSDPLEIMKQGGSAATRAWQPGLRAPHEHLPATVGSSPRHHVAGTSVLKFGRHGRPGKRAVFLTEDGAAIMWYSKRKKADQSRGEAPGAPYAVVDRKTA